MVFETTQNDNVDIGGSSICSHYYWYATLKYLEEDHFPHKENETFFKENTFVLYGQTKIFH